jgi:hypothetical protein
MFKLKFIALTLLISVGFSNVIKMEYGEVRKLPFESLYQVTALTNTRNVLVWVRENKLILKAVRPGDSSILLLSSRGPKIIKLIVNPVKIVKEDPSVIDYSGRQFVSNLSVGYGDGKSSSTYSANNWSYNYTYYKLDTKGETPWGSLTSKLSIKNRLDSQGLQHFSTELKNGYGIFKFGDQFERRSSLLLPSQALQGIGYNGIYGKSKVYFFLGNNRNGRWGSVLAREVRTTEAVAYGQWLYSLDRHTKFGANVSNTAYGLLYNSVYSSLSFKGEYAADQNQNTASLLSVGYDNRANIRANLTYKNVAEGFDQPTGFATDKGYNGVDYSLSWQATKAFNLFYGGQSYLNSISTQNLTNYNHNVILKADGEKVHPVLPILTLRYWQNKSESFDSSYTYITALSSNATSTENLSDHLDMLQTGQSIRLQKEIAKAQFWVDYLPAQYDNVSSSNASYTKNSFLMGVRYPLFDFLTLQSEYRQNAYEYTSTSSTEVIFDHFMILNPIRFLDNKLQIGGFYQLRNQLNKNTDEQFWHYFSKLELLYRPNADGSIRLVKYYTKKEAPASYESSADLDETRLEFSQNFNYIFNYGRPRGQVVGMVFEDENYNGKYDEGERGLNSVRVFLSNGAHVTTNKLGFYKFRNLQDGKYGVNIDPERVDLVLTNEFPNIEEIGVKKRKVINQGVIVRDIIKGHLFIDSNENGVKDSSEKGFAGVRLFVGKEIVKTDHDGYYEFLIKDSHQNIEVMVDLTTAPDDYHLIGARKMMIKERSKSVNFIFKDSDLFLESDYFKIEDIQRLDGNAVQLQGHVSPEVLSFYVNDVNVPLTGSNFNYTFVKTQAKVKVKVFTRYKKSFIQHFYLK